MDIFSFVNNIQPLQATILLLGIVFFVVEMFTPGFGVAGGLGLTLFVIGIILTAKSAFEALVMFIILLAIVGLMIAIVLNSASKGKLSKVLILNDTLNHDSGFTSTDDMAYFVGREGVALTVLRPSGTGEFDGLRLDIVTEGDFINKNTPIRIVSVSGRRIAVEPITKSSTI